MPRFYLTTPPKSVTYVLNLLCYLCSEPAPSDVRCQMSGAVRTSVTLLVQNMGNTLLLIVYTSFVPFAVLFGQIAATFCTLSKRLSARIKLLAVRSTWPKRSRPNQTSIKSAAMGLSPTDQPAKLALRKTLSPFKLINPVGFTRRVHICEYSKSSGVP